MGVTDTASTTFGAYLRVLRRRARITQRELVPELSVLAALFVPALGLARDPASAARLVGTERVVVLQGLAGTGKTTLAAAYAQGRAAQVAVCWITATPGVTASAEAVVRQLAAHLADQSRPGVATLTGPSDAAPLPLDRQVDLLAGALAQHPTLVCLDNAQEVAGDVVATLAHLAATAGIRLLLVSRTSLDLPGGRSGAGAGRDTPVDLGRGLPGAGPLTRFVRQLWSTVDRRDHRGW